MIRVAKRLKKLGFKGKIIKYVAPQVWAMRAGRAKILAKFTDLLLSIQPMDAPFFEPQGLETFYVGNPVFDTDYRIGNERQFRERHKLSNDRVISVWFGSRPSEISQLTADFCEAIEILECQNPNLIFVAPIAESVRKILLEHMKSLDLKTSLIFVEESEKIDVMSTSYAALACSGTVTTQLASAGVPTVVAYRLNAMTYYIAKWLFKPSFISIVNIAADKALMPEYIQENISGGTLAEALNAYLCNEMVREASSQALLKQTNMMGANSDDRVNEKTASVILTALNS
jgi:lipid-A-disaccharide synthase